MAHGDYNCCAVCDCKLDYNAFDARTKEDICIDCLKSLRTVGVNVLDTKELIEWMKNEKPEKVKLILDSIGFDQCFYDDNDVDNTYRKLVV